MDPGKSRGNSRSGGEVVGVPAPICALQPPLFIVLGVSGEASSDSPSLDTILSQLETVVRELEGGELSLEDSLARFEVGIGLSRQGKTLLGAMETRVEQLLEDGTCAPLASSGQGDTP